MSSVTVPPPTSDIPSLDPSIPDSLNPPSPRTSFYDKTTPKERQKINHAIVNRMPATYKAIYAFFNLRAKGIHYFAFYRYARKLRDRADAALVADLVAPDAKDSPKVIMRLAANECISALLHPEEEGSARKLSRNNRVYSDLRRHELVAEKTAATIEVARIRAEAQRDCTKMRTEAQRDVADLRTQCADHMNERRIKTQRDTVQFKADCAAARHNALYAGTESSQPPPSNSTPTTPPPPTISVICSDRLPHSASPAPTNRDDDISTGDLEFASPRFKRRPRERTRNQHSETHVSPASSTSDIPHPTSAIPSHPAFAGDAAPFGRRTDGTKRSHLEYWIRLKQRCREILRMPEQDKDWPPDISEALAVRPPERAAQRLREVLKRRSSSTLNPGDAAPDVAGVEPPLHPANENASHAGDAITEGGMATALSGHVSQARAPEIIFSR